MSDVATLEIVGLEDFINDVNDANHQIPSIIFTAMSQSTNGIRVDAANLAPWRTGHLKASIFSLIQDGGMTGIVYQDPDQAPYGAAIEFGTVGMTINVPNGRRTKNGRTRPYSFIGNIQPQPYLIPAFDNNLGIVQAYFEAAVEKIVKIAGGQA